MLYGVAFSCLPGYCQCCWVFLQEHSLKKNHAAALVLGNTCELFPWIPIVNLLGQPYLERIVQRKAVSSLTELGERNPPLLPRIRSDFQVPHSSHKHSASSTNQAVAWSFTDFLLKSFPPCRKAGCVSVGCQWLSDTHLKISGLIL